MPSNEDIIEGLKNIKAYEAKVQYVMKNDKGEEKLLEFKWATAEELKDIDLRPVNIRDMLISEEYLKGLSHIVKRG